MIRNSSYGEFADQQIDDIRNGLGLHGGNFSNLLFYDAHSAARVYREFVDRLGPPATAAEFANHCSWNTPDDADEFVQENEEWPPRAVLEELRYM